MRFRILSNGIRYKAQFKGVFGWQDLKGLGSGVLFFDTYSKAVDCIVKKFGTSSKIEKPFVVVSGPDSFEAVKTADVAEYITALNALDCDEHAQKLHKTDVMLKEVRRQIRNLRCNVAVMGKWFEMVEESGSEKIAHPKCTKCRFLDKDWNCTSVEVCVRGDKFDEIPVSDIEGLKVAEKICKEVLHKLDAEKDK